MIQSKKIDLYGDGIGSVEYVQHMGEDITVVNSARVSFGKHKEELDGRDKKLIKANNYCFVMDNISNLF